MWIGYKNFFTAYKKFLVDAEIYQEYNRKKTVRRGYGPSEPDVLNQGPKWRKVMLRHLKIKAAYKGRMYFVPIHPGKAVVEEVVAFCVNKGINIDDTVVVEYPNGDSAYTPVKDL